MSTSKQHPSEENGRSLVVSQVLHATTAVNGTEVHVTVRVHCDKRITFALPAHIAASLGHSLVRAAKRPSVCRKAKPSEGGARMPILKPSGRVL